MNVRISRMNTNVSLSCLYPKSTQALSLQALHLQSLLMGLERRLPQLEKDMSMLEKEDDGDLYGVISLQLLENELYEIRQLLDRLNSTTLGQQRLSDETTKQVNISSRGSSQEHSIWEHVDVGTCCVMIIWFYMYIHYIPYTYIQYILHTHTHM